MKFIHNDPLLKQYRKELRNGSTKEEILLWKYLKLGNKKTSLVPAPNKFGVVYETGSYND